MEQWNIQFEDLRLKVCKDDWNFCRGHMTVFGIISVYFIKLKFCMSFIKSGQTSSKSATT